MKHKIFLLHGMGGNKSDWDFTSPGLDAVEPIPVELSEFFSSASIEEMAEEIATHISESTSGEFSLCGYSMGGRLAILIAQNLSARGKKPKNLLLISAGLGFRDENQRTLRLKSDLAWAALAGKNIQLFWEKWYAQDLFSTFGSLPNEKQQKWLELRKSIDYKHLEYQLCSLSPAKHAYLLPTLLQLLDSRISVLYIAGELDKKYLNLAQELAQDNRIAMAVCAQANHLIPLEAPAELAALINNFCKLDH